MVDAHPTDRRWGLVPRAGMSAMFISGGMHLVMDDGDEFEVGPYDGCSPSWVRASAPGVPVT